MSAVDKIMSLPAGAKVGGGVLAVGGVGGGVLAFTQGSLFPYLIGLAVITLMGVIGWFTLRAWERAKKRAAAKRFAEDMDDGIGEAEGLNKAAEEELKNRLLEGVRLYEKSGTSVYESPWFVLVGPPSAGKTVLLQKCGLVDREKMLQGTGGTKGMNWWFIDADLGGDEPLHAVVLDMAGAVFMDSRQEGRWNTFLEFLRKNRPYEPLNGVLLVVSVEDLLGKTPEKLAEEGATIRAQLERIREKLDVRFPVWVVVTKCDRVDGFKEFFDTIKDPTAQAQIFGWSKPGKVDGLFNPKVVETEVQAIIERLRRYRMRSLADMVIGDQRVDRQADLADTMFTLPATFTELGQALQRYLEVVFARKKVAIAPPFFRGIYFTSSERKGAAISDWLSKTGGQFREEDWPDRPFFNKEMFTRKVFREVNLVTAAENVDKMKRTRKVAGYVAASVCAAVLILASAASFFTLQSNFGKIAGYYGGLAGEAATDESRPVDKFVAAASKGEPMSTIAKLELAGRDGTAETIGEVLEGSQDFAGRKVGAGLFVRTLYFLPQLVFGSVEQAAERRGVHERLTRDAVVKPLIEQSLRVLADEKTWEVESPDDLGRFDVAVKAQQALTRLAVQTQGGDPSTPSKELLEGDDEPKGLLRLKPLIDLMVKTAPTAAEGGARAWWLTVDERELARLEAAIDGVSGRAAKGDTPARAELPPGFTKQSLSQIEELLARDQGGLEDCLKTFRDSLDKQSKGQAGILKLLLDLGERHAEADGVLERLNTLTSDKREMTDESTYSKFASDWKKEAEQLTRLAKESDDLMARLKIETDGLSKQLEKIEEAQAEAHKDTLELVKPTDADKTEAGTRGPAINSWIRALGNKPAGFDKVIEDLELPGSTREAWLPLLIAADGATGEEVASGGARSRAMSLLAQLAGEIGTTLGKGSAAWQSEWPPLEGGPLSLVDFDPSKRLESIKAMRASFESARKRLSRGEFEKSKAASTFALSAKDKDTTVAAALELCARRVRGEALFKLVGMPNVQDVLKGVNGASEKMLAEFSAELKPMEISGALPLAPIDGRGIPKQRREEVLRAIGTLRSSLQSEQPAPGRKRPAEDQGTEPIIDDATRASLDRLVSALNSLRDELVKYWRTEIGVELTVAPGRTLSEVAAAIESIDGETACKLLEAIAKERTDAGAESVRDPRWEEFGTAAVVNTKERCAKWLDGVKRLLQRNKDKPLELRELLLDPRLSDLHYDPRKVEGLPYFGSLAEALVRAIVPEVHKALGDECRTASNAKGFPLYADATNVIPSGDLSGWLATIEKAALTRPGTAQQLDGSDKVVGVSAALRELRAVEPPGSCAVSPDAMTLAKTLASGKFRLKIESYGGVSGAGTPIENLTPELRVDVGGREIMRFGTFRGEGTAAFEIEYPASGEVTMTFRDAAEGTNIRLRFATPWHVFRFITNPAYAKPMGSNSWEVAVPDLSADSYFNLEGAQEKLSLRVKVTAIGASFPPPDAWPKQN